MLTRWNKQTCLTCHDAHPRLARELDKSDSSWTWQEVENYPNNLDSIEIPRLQLPAVGLSNLTVHLLVSAVLYILGPASPYYANCSLHYARPSPGTQARARV